MVCAKNNEIIVIIYRPTYKIGKYIVILFQIIGIAKIRFIIDTKFINVQVGILYLRSKKNTIFLLIL